MPTALPQSASLNYLKNELSVNRVFQTFTSFKFRLSRSWNLNSFTRTWVPTCRCFTLSCGESAKTYDTNFTATLQSTYDGIEDTGDCFTCIGF